MNALAHLRQATLATALVALAAPALAFDAAQVPSQVWTVSWICGGCTENSIKSCSPLRQACRNW